MDSPNQTKRTLTLEEHPGPATYTMSDRHDEGLRLFDSPAASEAGSLPGEMIECFADKYTSPCCVMNYSTSTQTKYDTEQCERALHA